MRCVMRNIFRITTCEEAIDLVNELQIPKAYFTHISHQLGKHKLVGDFLPQECTWHSMDWRYRV